MLVLIPTLAFASVAYAACVPDSKTAPKIPIYYPYGGYPRIQTNISWGTPPQEPIAAIFDTGSLGFWTFGPGAKINDGSQFLGVPGKCNFTVQHIFNWPKSSTHSPVVNLTKPLVYSYGGNSKSISAYQEINDTISFAGTGFSPIKNTQVALADFDVEREQDPSCDADVNSFDQSIMGMGPFGVGNSVVESIGPSLRTNMRTSGQISSNILSMWMDKAPTDVRGLYEGTALLGQPLPKSAYTGNLVPVKQMVPDVAYIGYYTALPSLSVNGKDMTLADKSVVNCLIDSGTGQDLLPFSSDDVAKSSKVFTYTTSVGFLITSYNGSCDSILPSETFDFTFQGAEKGKSVVIKLPIRSYVRGTSDGLDVPKDICPLTLTLDNYGSCTFGAPFFTALAAQFNDDTKEISFAQGGVS